MSSAEQYYYGPFREHILQWLKLVGAMDVRTDGVPEFRYGAVFRQRMPAAWEHIPYTDLPWFLNALTFTILIDQVMYSHFQGYYHSFQIKTQYPKMWALIHMNPFEILHRDVLYEHGIGNDKMKEMFAEFSEFFVEDLKEFFESRNDMPDWRSVSEAMQNDSDIARELWGRRFVACLERRVAGS